ncbi:MAG TPA: ABC transporter permease, partial [Candidatus Baltobacteraceae bacterium]
MARFFAYVPEALEGIWRNRTRSLLSILGMLIGIASVIGVLGLSQAGANGMKATLAAGGDPGFIAMPDQSQNNPQIATMYYRDTQLLPSYAPGEISRAIPIYQSNFRLTANGKSDVIGLDSTDTMHEGDGVRILSGRRIEQTDIDGGANVGLLSESAAERFFPDGDAVGRSINVNAQRIKIVGVFTITGSLFNSLSGDALYVPYTTAHHMLPGPIGFIQFWSQPGTAGVDAIAAARAALARIHPRAQYIVQDQRASLGVFENVLASMGIGLTFIGGIALFVAGVGIMNIMLVSVTERTREIGIRKSIGASASDIATQFLIEAAILSLTGGVLGTLLGVGAVLFGRGVIAQTVGAAPVPWALIIGVAAGFSMIVGIGFGSYPAARAGRLDPVEALRS